MKSQRSISLNFWLPLLVTVFFVLLFSLMSWQAYMNLESDLQISSLRFVTQDMASLQREMEKELNGGDLFHADQALSARGVNSQYQVLVATNAGGLILYATRLDLKGQQATEVLPEFDSQRFSRIQQDQRPDVYLDQERQQITAYFPLTLVRQNDEIRPSHTGALFLLYDLREGHAKILSQVGRASFPVGLLLLFAMMGLIAFLRYFVTRPTQHLAEVAWTLAEGKIGLQSKIHGSGELAMLGKAFNNMSVQLKEYSEERKKIEETLRDREERLRTIYEQSNDAIFLLDFEQDRILDFNQKAVTLLEYPREDLYHIPISAIHAKDIDKLKDFSQSILNEGGKTRELICLTKSGKCVPAEVSASIVAIKEKSYLLCFVRDISERKRFDAEVLQYKNIVSSTPDMLALLGGNYIYLSANAAYLNAFDRTVEEVIGRTPTDLFGEAFFKKMIKPRADRSLTGENVRYQDWIDFPGTGRKYMDVSFSPHYDQQKKVAGFVVNARDLTENKQAEEALKKSEMLLSETGKIAKIGGWELDALTFEVSWTEETSRIHELPSGYMPPLEEVINYYHPDDRQKIEKAVKKALEQGEPYDLELRFITAKGKHLWIHTNGKPVIVKNKVIKLIGTFHDITRRKQAEEERAKLEARLRQNQKLESIGTLAGGVAHEINNPITGIMSYAQLIQDRLDPEDPLCEFAGEIGRESERIAEIVRNLLSFARQEKALHSLANISDILHNTLTLIRTIIHRDQIALKVDVSDNLPMLKCRSQQIRQVILNLLTNARDALNTRYPGHDPDKVMTVTVRTFTEEGRQWIRTMVEDHGIGIPGEMAGHLFDPFFTTKDRSQGTGLGLSISYGIVQDHHGKLYFESEAGKYTRFYLDLPVDNGWQIGT